ncbi:two-component sensor histidine kinase, partial [Bacillus cereus]
MNSLVFILLIGVLGSIVYSYTYKRIYNEVDQSIKMMAQYGEKLDVKIPPRKRMAKIQIGDPRVTRITWNGKIVKIEGDNRKFRSIFEENLEKFSPKKLEDLQDI